MKTFDRQSLEAVLAELGRRAWRDQRRIEISIYGGGAMALLFDHRRITQDLDAVFEKDRAWMRQQIAEIAEQNAWHVDWLNDAVKGYLSRKDVDNKQLAGMYPSPERPGLRVLCPTPEYLFAMKAIALRSPSEAGPEGAQDLEDLRQLHQQIDLETLEEALDLVSAFYPHRQIPPRTALGSGDPLCRTRCDTGPARWSPR